MVRLTSSKAESLLPRKSKAEMRSEYEGQGMLIAWKTFTSRVQKNPFMKRVKQKEQKGLCPICHKYVDADGGLLHHIDYGHICRMPDCVLFPRPTEKRPHRMVKAPDCETCSRINPRDFAECASRLRLVHKGCHMRIHDVK